MIAFAARSSRAPGQCFDFGTTIFRQREDAVFGSKKAIRLLKFYDDDTLDPEDQNLHDAISEDARIYE